MKTCLWIAAVVLAFALGDVWRAPMVIAGPKFIQITLLDSHGKVYAVKKDSMIVLYEANKLVSAQEIGGKP